jgi:hypothetical protein
MLLENAVNKLLNPLLTWIFHRSKGKITMKPAMPNASKSDGLQMPPDCRKPPTNALPITIKCRSHAILGLDNCHIQQKMYNEALNCTFF